MNTAVENGICSSCGVEARNGALFCYNCGGAVTKKITPEEEKSTSDVWFRGEIVEKDKVTEEENTAPQNGKKEPVHEKEPETETPETPETKESQEEEPLQTETEEEPLQKVKRKAKPEIEEKKILKPKGKLKRNSKLRSASALRKKPKTIGSKKIEVVWEERENSPNVLFLLVAFFLVSAAAGIFFLAMYLK
jgi:hypothetical protein